MSRASEGATRQRRPHRVVRVREGVLREGPGLAPRHALVVHEDAHEFRDGNGRVRVVQLEHRLGGQQVPVARVLLLEPRKHVLQCRSTENSISMAKNCTLTHTSTTIQYILHVTEAR